MMADTGCQVDFYVLAETAGSAEQLACRLSLMAWEQGGRVAIVASGVDEARAVDELMWDYPPQRFLPHGIDDAGAPVCIVAGAGPVPAGRDVVVNLGGTAIAEPGGLRRVLEIVPADERQRAASRDKYRHYRGLGLRPDTHRITNF